MLLINSAVSLSWLSLTGKVDGFISVPVQVERTSAVEREAGLSSKPAGPKIGLRSRNPGIGIDSEMSTDSDLDSESDSDPDTDRD